MQLTDPKLAFANPLIDHWESIRRAVKKLVPWQQDVRPTVLLKVLPMTSMLDLSNPGEAFIAVMGKRIRSRYAPDARPRDWYEVLPKEAAEAAKKMVDRLATTPCGVYYRYRLADTEDRTEDGEAMALPLMTEKDRSKPSAWISLTNTSMTWKERTTIVAAALVLGPCLAHPTHAQSGDVSKCDPALIMDASSSREMNAWSRYAATLITADQWTQIRQRDGDNAIIYGIPLATNYKSYHETAIKQHTSDTFISNGSSHIDQARSVLSAHAGATYAACLGQQFGGIAAWVSHRGTGTVTVNFNFLTDDKDKKERNFVLKAIGADIDPSDTKTLKRVQGKVLNYPIVMRHHTHQEVVLTIAEGTLKVVIRAPLEDRIFRVALGDAEETPVGREVISVSTSGQSCLVPSQGEVELIAENQRASWLPAR